MCQPSGDTLRSNEKVTPEENEFLTQADASILSKTTKSCIPHSQQLIPLETHSSTGRLDAPVWLLRHFLLTQRLHFPNGTISFLCRLKSFFRLGLCTKQRCDEFLLWAGAQGKASPVLHGYGFQGCSKRQLRTSKMQLQYCNTFTAAANLVKDRQTLYSPFFLRAHVCCLAPPGL